jgi:hypothetical protein
MYVYFYQSERICQAIIYKLSIEYLIKSKTIKIYSFNE